MVTLSAVAQVNNPADLVKAASSTAIEDTLRRMRPRFRRWDRWLTERHPYTNVVTALESNTSTIDGSKLAEYIAASIPLHVADGWTFLARAFESIRAGDRNTAVHLAYYAELRAAMSLLASEGVGVFNRQHVAVGQTYISTVLANRGTHRAAWDLLESWADDTSRVATLLTAIKVESRTIDEWFDEIGIAQSVQHLVARRWLRTWSIDLTYFPEDQALRNQTSYRPSRISPKAMNPIDPATEVIDPLLRTWDALEPSPDSGGAAIDRALLFRALSLGRNQPTSSTQTWERFIDQLKEVASQSLLTQLKDPAIDEYYVLEWADNRSKPPPTQAVLARATLLLRIANGICAQRLAAAHVSKQDLRFWWSRFGEDGGLWSDHADLDSFADLWLEVSDARDDVENSLASAGSSHTMSDLHHIIGQEVALTQFSRTPLWLFGVD